MLEKKSLADRIADMADRSSCRKIVNKDVVAKNIFELLLRQVDLQETEILMFLSAADGLILHVSAPDLMEDISGYRISLEGLRSCEDELFLHGDGKDYMIVSSDQQEVMSAVHDLQEKLDALLDVFEHVEIQNGYLLNCLDSVGNAISIYDKDAQLLFGNSVFYKDLHIENKDAVIGKDIRDILQDHGIKVHSMENNSNRLKMMDVIEKGQEALDWEVRIEFGDNPDGARFVSNDMYPILNKEGKVEGMVELTHSRQQDIKRSRKIIGLAAEYTFDDIIGKSSAIKEKIKMAKEFAGSPFNFLITGESGVGKELFAQSIHNHSPRKRGPFVALNCASIPEGLIESELFGYVNGAFTGASRNGQIGKFELADKGTLFLDEIGELPYHFQSKLLRVLETWMVTRIGSSRQIPVNVRLIAATNRNLGRMVEEGLFRQDLYYRLQVLNIEIPPLRERQEDLLPLAESFLKQSGDSGSGPPKSLDIEAQRTLLEYDWPGNVRELRNVMNRITILSKDEMITREVLEASIYSKGYLLKHGSDETPEERIEKRKMEISASYANLLKEALDITGGNKLQAAKLLGISRKTFYDMLEKYKV